MTNSTVTSEFAYSGKEQLDSMKAFPRYINFVEGFLADFASGAERAVDFGAGLGEYAERMKRRGVNIHAVELDAEYADSLRQRGIPTESDIAHYAGEFSHLYSCDVLEHIADDVGMLKQIHAKLSAKGRILMYVPAFPVLFSALDENVGHFRRYRKAELVHKMQEAGFVVERAEYVDSLGFFASLLFKYICDSKGSIDSPMIRFYYRYLFPVSRLADRLGGKYLCGKNLLVIGYKR